MRKLKLSEPGCYICLMPCGVKTTVIFDRKILSHYIIRPYGKKPVKFCDDFIISSQELSCSGCPESAGQAIQILETLPLLNDHMTLL